MHYNLLKGFTYSCGAILAITASAKLIGGSEDAQLLNYLDPIFKIPFSHLLLAVGILEIGIAVICFFPSQLRAANYLVAWFSTSLLVYRLGTWYVHWHRPCGCLGGLTDAIHITPQTADMAMKIVLAYLLIGSYGSLFCLWRQHKKGAA